MSLLPIAQQRYSCKVFDKSKKISNETLNELKEIIRLSASSLNLQPWHFIVVSSDEAKQKAALATEGMLSFNTSKITDASHTIILCVRNTITNQYIDKILDQEQADGGIKDEEEKDARSQAYYYFLGLHENMDDVKAWSTRQLYIALNSILLGAQSLGIDAVPIEGVNTTVLDEQFAIQDTDYSAALVVSLGYRSEDDFNASLNKSRLPSDELFSEV